jgi:hypothetical protein
LWGRGDDGDDVLHQKLFESPGVTQSRSLSAAAFAAVRRDEWSGCVAARRRLCFVTCCTAWRWRLGAGLSQNSACSGGDGVDDRNVRRGSSIASADAVARTLRREQSRFDIGGVPVPTELETRSFLFAGSPGTGKSQALTRALDALEKDNARAILADPSGQFAERFYNPARGDIILNPHDARSVSWSPLSEIESLADIPALAKSLVPDGEGEGRVWSNYAQQFLEAVIEHCVHRRFDECPHFFALVTSASVQQLQQVCAGTPAAALVQPGNEKMFASLFVRQRS